MAAVVESGQEPVNAQPVEAQAVEHAEAPPVAEQYDAPVYSNNMYPQQHDETRAYRGRPKNDWDAQVESQDAVQGSALASGKMKGTCKWFNNPRGYGFIEGEDGVDYFVHQTSIKARGYKSLKEGEALEFDLSNEEGRVKAINVTGPGGVDVQGNPGTRDSYGGGGGRGGGFGGGSGRTNVCFAWQKGVCDRGDSCRFAHSEDGGGGGGGYGGGGGGMGYGGRNGGGGFGGGNSFGGGGGFGGAGRKRGVCFAWQRGECFRGDSCKFSHEDDGGGGGGGGGGSFGGGRGRGASFGEKRGVCYAWQRGECWRGDACRFEHQETE